eukprot:CAMPEP_0117467250 /NCGR_PEP_ID=MMETSP0784-20121206/5557_1 /TAXON_ID=39447 /ORGANISM="" /LENGTH=298 /DNA_ID=CAMNT_0005261209 /DNA_START=216 /DNA_END=1112 /DNA_ORIENTATION=+
MLFTAPFTISLLTDAHQPVTNDGETLRDLGLDGPNASMVVVRLPGSSEDWDDLSKQLINAIELNRHSEIHNLIGLGAGFDGDGNLLKHRVGTSTSTVLHFAIRKRFSDFAKVIIARGGDVNGLNDSGRSAIVQAVLLKLDQSVVSALLDARADVEVPDQLGRTALYYAVSQRNDTIAAMLVAAGSCDFQGNPGLLKFQSPVLTCCSLRMPRAAMALLEAEAAFEGRDDLGRTALHFAYGLGAPYLVDALLERGADAEARDNARKLPAESPYLEDGSCTDDDVPAPPRTQKRRARCGIF